MGKKEVDEIMRKVREWLVEEGIYKDKAIDEDTTYHFVVENPPRSGRLTHLVQPKAREDLLLIASAIDLSQEHYEALKAMPKPKREEILWDIRFQLLFRESEFQMVPSAEELKTIQFTRPIYFDGLTKDRLMGCLREDFKANLFIIWKMKQLFGEAPPPSVEPMFR